MPILTFKIGKRPKIVKKLSLDAKCSEKERNAFGHVDLTRPIDSRAPDTWRTSETMFAITASHVHAT